MLKKFLLLTGVAVALITAGSSEIPAPPCTPNCNGLIDSGR
jgi:hypothetical protein